MTLKIYQRKRKFKRTPEPRGKKSRGKGELRFVVHQHAASRMHYDLRIEMGGVFKSWAVPKGPSLNPLDQRLAIFVEDHPIEYGSFEGVIPKGNYGAGTVMIWDEGTYRERNSKNRKESEDAMLKGLAGGHVTFLLEGKKLQGEFALVRLKRNDEKTWLLVKKRDEFKTYRDITLENTSAHSGRTMEEIAEQSTTENSIWLPKSSKRKVISTTKSPKTIVSRKPMPRRIHPMLPITSAAVPAGKGWIFERFGDGLRAIAEVEKGKVRLYSRSFLPFERKFPQIDQHLKNIDQVLILDGEIRSPKKGDEQFSICDLLYCDGKDLRLLPLDKRKVALEKLGIFDDRILLNSHSAQISKLSGEGSVLARQAESLYRSGTSKEWLKIKADAKVESSLRFSHLDKIYWPKEKYTKQDLITYYREVAPILLPHLKDRPQSLHRHPDGITRPGFFHKNMTGYLPSFIKTTRIHSRPSEKTVNYLLCQNEETLLYLANYGCIELNPWLSRVGSLDNPDYLVIDLDPDGNSFSEVMKVAKEVRRVLEEIGAKGWCKTSGATGLHICIPTQGRYDYDTTKEFAEKICKFVQKIFPRLTSVERNPNKRRGLIYLDFLQNRRSQTLAAPYCVRPRPGATVSTPLDWRELKPGLKPEQFTIKTMPARLKRVGDLWKPMLSAAVNLSNCEKNLTQL